ncbi:MAG: ThuA domain-containing protein [Verrucomicrobia bacterium]|nr:ThuA domain-containing protein [Verrucomicrobiota bacterium]
MKALIVWGGWEGHQPRECAAILEESLRTDGADVTTSNETTAFVDSDLGKFDLVVPIFTMGTIAREESQNLSRTIREGTGLAGFHGGMGDSFRSDTDYQFMVGGQWVAHPGNVIDYEVNIVDTSDPIMDGITDFAYHSEQYYMHVDPSNHVLATTTFSGEYCDWIAGVVMPVVWKRRHGLGRVFYSSLGHKAAEFQCEPMLKILQRGMRWAARQ